MTAITRSQPDKQSEIRVVLGLGCDRGAAATTIEEAINHALQQIALTTNQVVAVASIDKKSDEVGLLTICKKHGWHCTWYSAAELAEVEVPNPSAVVQKYVGTPSVGEAAAILRAGATKESLLIEKYRYRGECGRNATVAICILKSDSIATNAATDPLTKQASK
ncbi:MAG: cobalamin biosynthesis protein [Mariprofundales bacterium]|nr:cobalamin biosynthesis protein [Mariprofundales bacterium]